MMLGLQSSMRICMMIFGCWRGEGFAARRDPALPLTELLIASEPSSRTQAPLHSLVSLQKVVPSPRRAPFAVVPMLARA